MSKRRSKQNDTENVVIVKPIAYYKMLVHILRFGNKVRNPNQYNEVMGMLIGHLEGEGNIKDVIVEDAVPISHGGSIDVEFSAQDYGTFALVDEEAFSQGKHAVGWYHSHPALRIFWSSTDIRNQLFWQTDNNPSGIGIVFDHTYLENPGDLGFRTFRLTDYTKGLKSDYHEINTIVEPPNSMDYYFKLIELINCIHQKEPPILEINETLDIFGEFYFPNKMDLLSKKPELNLEDLIKSLYKGLTNLMKFSLEPLVFFLNNWSQTIIKGLMDNNLKIRDDLEEIKNIIVKNVSNLQSNFKTTLLDKLDTLNTYFNDKFETFDEENEHINGIIDILKENIELQINDLFEQKINAVINEKLNLFDIYTNNLGEIENNTQNLVEKIKNQEISLGSLSVNADILKNKRIAEIDGIQEKTANFIKNNVDTISNDLSTFTNELNSFSAKFELSFNELESITKNLNNKLNDFENQNKDLIEKITKLENRNGE